MAVVNPFVARRFAQGLGLLAKTDRIDAWMLAVYGQKANPRLKPLNLNKNLALAELNARRRQLSQMIIMETNRLKRIESEKIKHRVQMHLNWLAREHEAIMVDIETEIAKDEQNQQRFELLQTVKGIGKRVASALIGELPELGTSQSGTNCLLSRRCTCCKRQWQDARAAADNGRASLVAFSTLYGSTRGNPLQCHNETLLQTQSR